MFKAIDLYAGLGGMRKGFEQAFGKELEVIYAFEPDKLSRDVYRYNYDDRFEIGCKFVETDVIHPFDICFAQLPLSAPRTVINDSSSLKVYGDYLMREIYGVCDRYKPKVVFLECDKALATVKKGKIIKIIENSFEEREYRFYCKILNSKDFGVPQNRLRLYIVCISKECLTYENDTVFKFPESRNIETKLKDIIETSEVLQKYYLSEEEIATLKDEEKRGFSGYAIHNSNEIANPVSYGTLGINRNLFYDDVNDSIRVLTPLECARLQGYPKGYKLMLSDTSLYKRLGNSVTINVVKAVAEQIKEILIPSNGGKEENSTDVAKDMSNKKEDCWQYNFGEWSEAYAFLKILVDGRIFGANDQLQKDDSTFMDIVEVIRYEKRGTLRFERGEDIIIAYENDIKYRSMRYADVLNKAETLLREMKKIKEKKGKKGKRGSFLCLR